MFSKKSEYGIRAVLFLAAYSDEKNLMVGTDISKHIDVNEPMLSKILQYLAKRNFVISKKGRNGGFYMTEDQKCQKLIKIITELEQSEGLIGQCLMSQKIKCSKGSCPYHESVSGLKKELQTIYGKDNIKETAKKLNIKMNTSINN